VQMVLIGIDADAELAAYNSFKEAQAGDWKGGTQVLGLKEGGVDWALDKDNEKLVTPDMKARVDAAKADIVSGKIVVHDYMSNNSCKP
jgi:basic membrane protein A and related proteins